MVKMVERVLIVGACGQIGTELVNFFLSQTPSPTVITIDLKAHCSAQTLHYALDIRDAQAVENIILKHKPQEIYWLAAILSATGEKKPTLAWEVNVNGLQLILELGKKYKNIIQKIFWPSSIAVFGATTPPTKTPQYTVTEPTTMYGITKLLGERLCEYYFLNYQVDCRSLRYPGLISYSAPPGGGTTDYAVEIFHEALKKGKYTCFLKEDTQLPMMYMPDAIRATIELMNAPRYYLTVNSAYNITAFSFTPKELVQEIQKHLPDFSCSYEPDFRQAIADSWPHSLDDSFARRDWKWKPQFSLSDMVKHMLTHVKKQITS